MAKRIGQSRKSTTHTWKHLFVWTMLMVLILSVKLPVSAAVTNEDLAGPVVDKESHVDRGRHTSTYKYVYFGYYPQKEIAGEELTDAIKNASYDENGVGWVNGKKYQRLSFDMIPEDKYNRTEEKFKSLYPDGYMYFQYEPVKWRILKNNGNGTLLLLSERAIDNRRYDTNALPITWED